jgi:hypothetical protein
MRFRYLRIVALLLTAAMFAGYEAQAQTTTQPPPAVAPSPSPTPLRLGNLTVTGNLRLRSESWGWFETPAANNDYTFGAATLRLGLGQQKERFEWQIEGAFPLLINLPDDAIAPTPQGQLGLGANYFAANGRQDGSVFIKQAYFRFKGLGNVRRWDGDRACGCGAGDD